MKIKVITLWLSILLGLTLQAQQDQFEQAVMAFNKGSYQESVDLLENISKGDTELSLIHI